MTDLTFDVETYEKGKDGYYYPVLDATGGKFLIGSVTDDKMESKIFNTKEEMWNHIIEKGKYERKYGHTLYAFAHNLRYDFFNIMQREKGLVILCEQPFMAVYLIDGKEAIRFVDTINIFNRMSLKEVGQIVGLEKLSLPKKLKKEDLKETLTYVTRDTEVLMKAIKMLKKKLLDDGIGVRRLITMNQVAIACMTKMLRKENTPIFNVTGSKIIKCQYNNLIRKAYRGGRVEAWKVGITKGVSSIDCNSLYPYSANIMRFPDLRTERYWWKPEKGRWEYLLDKIGVCKCMLYNKNNSLGLIPIRTPKVNFFAGKGKYLIGIWTNEEIKKAIEEGYKLINVEYIVTFEEIANPFKKIMNELYKLRQDDSIGDFNKKFYKAIMNQSIGKFAQIRTGQNIVFGDADEIKKYEEEEWKCLGGIKDDSRTMMFKQKKEETLQKPYYCPLLSTLITAKARMIMYDAFKKIGQEKLVYTDTDSITFKGKIEDLKGIEIGNKMGQFKIEFEDKTFKCWGRKSYKTEDVLRLSGVSKNDLKNFDEAKQTIKYKRMKGIKEQECGLFVEEERDLSKQEEDYINQQRELEERLIYIDNCCLEEQIDYADYKTEYVDKCEGVEFFREELEKINKALKGGF